MDILNVPKVIDKPGIAPEVFEIVKNEQKEAEKKRRESLSPEERQREDELAHKQELKRIRGQRFYEIEPPKAYLQAINHGHYRKHN